MLYAGLSNFFVIAGAGVWPGAGVANPLEAAGLATPAAWLAESGVLPAVGEMRELWERETACEGTGPGGSGTPPELRGELPLLGGVLPRLPPESLRCRRALDCTRGDAACCWISSSASATGLALSGCAFPTQNCPPLGALTGATARLPGATLFCWAYSRPRSSSLSRICLISAPIRPFRLCIPEAAGVPAAVPSSLARSSLSFAAPSASSASFSRFPFPPASAPPDSSPSLSAALTCAERLCLAISRKLAAGSGSGPASSSSLKCCVKRLLRSRELSSSSSSACPQLPWDGAPPSAALGLPSTASSCSSSVADRSDGGSTASKASPPAGAASSPSSE
mmetsp:Transcript_27056/g.76263  ORF Transcript_27056/g.76263 Transcript_27056/m.76263 type:complete len:337 (+) Transcript_27056:1408-2418(+)